MKKHKKLRYLVFVAAIIFIIGGVVAVYSNMLQRAVETTTKSNIYEIASLNQNTLKEYVNIAWEDLDYIGKKIVSNKCDSMQEALERLNLERADSRFDALYFLDENGVVYSDTYVTYAPGDNPNYNFQELIGDPSKKFVSREDNIILQTGRSKLRILYSFPVKNLELEGAKITAIVGVADVSFLEDRLILKGFEQNGIDRAYSTILDMDGNFLINPNGMLIVNHNENLINDVDAADRSDYSGDDIRNMMHNHEEFEFRYSDKDGGYFVYAEPISDDIGWYFITYVEESVFTDQSRHFMTISIFMAIIILLIVAVLLLITMNNRAKAMTASAEARARSEFLSNMSHEIRTPLNGVLGLVHLSRRNIREGGPREQALDWLDKAESTANYLLTLISDILDISKLQAGRIDLEEAPISVAKIVDRLQTMQRSNIEDRGIRFVVEQDLEAPGIMGDETRITQVLMNIIGNAAKYTLEGGTIRFTTTQRLEGDSVETKFVVADTGIGMTEEFREHIWDSFSQERSRISNSIKGTGLGMAISKLIADAMEAELSVESKLDEGSTFTFVIHSKITEISDEEIGLEANEEMRQKRLHVLIAEDNELNAEILIEILRAEDITSELARNGQEVLELFAASETGHFDVILMDMQMPVMDGCAAAKAIRKLDREDAKTVRIFACTANIFKEDHDKAMEAGMDDFLAKPIDINDMMKKLSEGRK
ncbi:MAG: response regulator [Agathobacter sp.]|nr:response regulator [Agathobacter sp.]